VKIAYWFVRSNSVTCQSGAKKQVLFCGPSNSSVDVAAGMMNRLCCFELNTVIE